MQNLLLPLSTIRLGQITRAADRHVYSRALTFGFKHPEFLWVRRCRSGPRNTSWKFLWRNTVFLRIQPPQASTLNQTTENQPFEAYRRFLPLPSPRMCRRVSSQSLKANLKSVSFSKFTEHFHRRSASLVKSTVQYFLLTLYGLAISLGSPL